MHKNMLTPIRRVVRFLSDKRIPAVLAVPKPFHSNANSNVIVSFTSFPARINNVWQVVECMFRQSMMPNKIILWLSKEQFKTPDSIPLSLRDREGAIFEIRMVDGDIRSHKKYQYVSSEYPDSLVFLIDDDIYYPTDIIERSMMAHDLCPNSIICNYGYHIGYNEDGSLKPYNDWVYEHEDCSTDDLFFGSGGGTLFCPSELYKDLTNVGLALCLTPLADDIWLNAMTRLAKKPIHLLKNGLILPIKIKNNQKLASHNKCENMNDQQIRRLNEYYNNENGKNVF